MIWLRFAIPMLLLSELVAQRTVSEAAWWLEFSSTEMYMLDSNSIVHDRLLTFGSAPMTILGYRY